MMYMLPLTVVLLLIGWFLLKTFFPFKKKTIELEIEARCSTTGAPQSWP